MKTTEEKIKDAAQFHAKEMSESKVLIERNIFDCRIKSTYYYDQNERKEWVANGINMTAHEINCDAGIYPKNY